MARDYAYEALAEITSTDWAVGRGELNSALRDIRKQADIPDSYLLAAVPLAFLAAGDKIRHHRRHGHWPYREFYGMSLGSSDCLRCPEVSNTDKSRD